MSPEAAAASSSSCDGSIDHQRTNTTAAAAPAPPYSPSSSSSLRGDIINDADITGGGYFESQKQKQKEEEEEEIIMMQQRLVKKGRSLLVRCRAVGRRRGGGASSSSSADDDEKDRTAAAATTAAVASASDALHNNNSDSTTATTIELLREEADEFFNECIEFEQEHHHHRHHHNNDDSSVLVVLVSEVYDAVRSLMIMMEEEARSSSSSSSSSKTSSSSTTTWKPPSSFERRTHKFWVNSNDNNDDNNSNNTTNLTELLLTCAKEAPLLVYNKNSNNNNDDNGDDSTSNNNNSLTSNDNDDDGDDDEILWTKYASRISSVYFDSPPPSMKMYEERIVRNEGAKLFRIRWYHNTSSKKSSESEIVVRDNSNNNKNLVYLELKTHHEKWVDSKSVKERVAILEEDVMTFLSRGAPWSTTTTESKSKGRRRRNKKHGRHQQDVQLAEAMVRAANPTLEEEKMGSTTSNSSSSSSFDKVVDLFLTMRDLVVDNDLRPCVRSTYERLAFQSSQSNSLRFTVDRDVTLLDERSAYPRSWRLSDNETSTANIVRVPYSVFELKLAGGREAPRSIGSLKERGVVIDAAKFSKFLTGAAAFNKDKVNMLPYWADYPAFASVFYRTNHAESLASTSPVHRATTTTRTQSKHHNQDQASRTSSEEASSDLSLRCTEEGKLPEQDHAIEKNGAAIVTMKGRRCRRRSTSRFLLRSSALRKSNKASPAVKVAPKTRVRIEPKTHFANERTFIQWISAALLLVTISAILLDFRGTSTYPRNTGFALLGCALFTVVYAVISYYRRVHLLTSGSPYGYVDHIGPILLGTAVIVGVVVLFSFFLSEQRNITAPQRIYPSQNECYLHNNKGISLLEYQPSDVYVDNNRSNLLLVPSLDRITAVPRSTFMSGGAARGGGGVQTLLEIPGADLEAIAIADDGRIFAVSEVNGSESELIELEWTADDAGNNNSMGVLQRWTIPIPGAEGLAYVPPTTPDAEHGHLYVSGYKETQVEQASIEVFDVPPRVGDTSSYSTTLRPRQLNQNMLNQDLVDPKIGGLNYFEGVLYVLHDNAQVVRAWDIETGELLSQWKLPVAVDGSERQWEGIMLERQSAAAEGGSLRGTGLYNEDELILHLALDSPPQIWTIKVQDGTMKGDVILPACAAAP